MAESVGILGVEVINSFANPRSWAKNFLLGKKLRLELSERGSRGSEDAYSYAVPWCRIRTSSLIKYFC